MGVSSSEGKVRGGEGEVKNEGRANGGKKKAGGNVTALRS
jgi:hypothetical protein